MAPTGSVFLQPITLTPERLKAARSLPLDWNDQRLLLLD